MRSSAKAFLSIASSPEELASQVTADVTWAAADGQIVFLGGFGGCVWEIDYD